jgi:hypothetical protein
MAIRLRRPGSHELAGACGVASLVRNLGVGQHQLRLVDALAESRIPGAHGAPGAL